MIDVLISYAREDRDTASQLERHLEERGYAVWWDHDLLPHEEFRPTILSRIDAAKAVIVIWSKVAAVKPFVRAEASAAQAKKKLINTRLSDIAASDLPLPFSEIHCVDITARGAIESSLAKLGAVREPGQDSDLGIALKKIKVAIGQLGADMAVRKGETDLAVREYSDLIRLEPGVASHYLSRGKRYKDIDQLDYARDDFTSAIQRDPALAEAHLCRGHVHRSMKQHKLAIIDYGTAISLSPSDAVAYNSRGNAYFSLKEWSSSILDYNKAIKLNPHSATYWRNRGNAHRRSQNWDLALSDLTRAISISPGRADCYNLRGKVLLAKHRIERAIEDHTTSLSLKPANAAAVYTDRARCFEERSEYPLALRDYDLAIAADPDYTAAYKHRADLHLRRGKKDLADADIARVASLQQSGPPQIPARSEIP